MKVHHTGYYVTNIAEAVKTFEKLGYKVASNCVHDESRKISIQFLSHSSTGGKGGGGSEPLLELVEPDEDCTLFSKSVKKLGAHPYHICYECENFNDALKTLQTEGFLMIQPPKVAPAIDGRNVAFLYSDAIGLIELVEKEVTS